VELLLQSYWAGMRLTFWTFTYMILLSVRSNLDANLRAILLKHNAGEDQSAFQRGFEDSIRTNSEFVSYIRLKSNPLLKPGSVVPNDVLFELKGYPHSVTEQGPDCKCFFAIAKPYPSRNIAMWVEINYQQS